MSEPLACQTQKLEWQRSHWEPRKPDHGIIDEMWSGEEKGGEKSRNPLKYKEAENPKMQTLKWAAWTVLGRRLPELGPVAGSPRIPNQQAAPMTAWWATSLRYISLSPAAKTKPTKDIPVYTAMDSLLKTLEAACCPFCKSFAYRGSSRRFANKLGNLRFLEHFSGLNTCPSLGLLTRR